MVLHCFVDDVYLVFGILTKWSKTQENSWSTQLDFAEKDLDVLAYNQKITLRFNTVAEHLSSDGDNLDTHPTIGVGVERTWVGW